MSARLDAKEPTLQPIFNLIERDPIRGSCPALADHLIRKHGERNSDNLIKDAFRTLTSRYPSEKEHSILIQLLEDQKNLSEKNDKRDQFLKVGHYRARSKDSLLLTAVTNFVSTLMNFDETISKR